MRINAYLKTGVLTAILLSTTLAIIIYLVITANHRAGDDNNQNLAAKTAAANPYLSLSLLPQPQFFPGIIVQNTAGTSFTSSHWHGHWSLVFFGFTKCTDICPLQAQLLDKLIRQAQASPANTLQAIFITVDPEHDTPALLTTYLTQFNPTIIGLTPTPDQLDQLQKFFALTSTHSDHGMHSSRLFLIDPQSRYLGSFSAPHNNAQIWQDLQTIMQR